MRYKWILGYKRKFSQINQLNAKATLEERLCIFSAIRSQVLFQIWEYDLSKPERAMVIFS